MIINFSNVDLKIIRDAIDYEELHMRKLSQWEEKYGPTLQMNMMRYLAKKALARRVDLIMTLNPGDNDLTTEQCSNLARTLEAKLERDIKATHKLYKRIDSEGTLENIAKEELIPTFMLLDKLRDY